MKKLTRFKTVKAIKTERWKTLPRQTLPTRTRSPSTERKILRTGLALSFGKVQVALIAQFVQIIATPAIAVMEPKQKRDPILLGSLTATE
jgi:hypothetical protein